MVHINLKSPVHATSKMDTHAAFQGDSGISKNDPINMLPFVRTLRSVLATNTEVANWVIIKYCIALGQW